MPDFSGFEFDNDNEPKTDEGYILLARATYKKSKTWQSLTPVQKVIMITLLMMANHKDKQWWDGQKFITIKRGQVVTSLNGLKKACGKGISIQNIRTALLNLKKMRFLTWESTNLYRIITIENYDFYQSKENYLTKQLTKCQQTSNKPLTTNNNDKHDKHDNKEKDIIVEFVTWFNGEFGTKYRVQTYADKIKARLENFTVEDLKRAALAMKRDPHMMGQNDRRRVYATLEYITRNDKNVDKWLNQVKSIEPSKPQSDLIQFEPWQLEAQRRRKEKLAKRSTGNSV